MPEVTRQHVRTMACRHSLTTSPFCPHCRAETGVPCPACGTRNRQGAQFCVSCGADQEPALVRGGPAGSTGSRKALIAGVAVVALVAGLGAALAVSRSSDPRPSGSPVTSLPVSTSTTAPSPSTMPTTEAPDAKTAWKAVLAGHRGATASAVGPLTTTAVAAEGTAVFAYRFLDGRWQLRGTVDLGLEADTDAPVRVADLTGDGEPDFLVEVVAADTAAGTVVSAAGGAWRIVPFVGEYESARTAQWVANPRVEGSLLLSEENDCEPDCASGGSYIQPWSYDDRNGVFYPNNGPGTPGGSGE